MTYDIALAMARKRREGLAGVKAYTRGVVRVDA
jgi:hypothetical protein